PSTSGNGTGVRNAPERTNVSTGFTALASTRTSTSSGPGEGTGRSSYRMFSAPPSSSTYAAFIRGLSARIPQSPYTELELAMCLLWQAPDPQRRCHAYIMEPVRCVLDPSSHLPAVRRPRERLDHGLGPSPLTREPRTMRRLGDRIACGHG